MALSASPYPSFVFFLFFFFYVTISTNYALIELSAQHHLWAQHLNCVVITPLFSSREKFIKVLKKLSRLWTQRYLWVQHLNSLITPLFLQGKNSSFFFLIRPPVGTTPPVGATPTSRSDQSPFFFKGKNS